MTTVDLLGYILTYYGKKTAEQNINLDFLDGFCCILFFEHYFLTDFKLISEFISKTLYIIR